MSTPASTDAAPAYENRGLFSDAFLAERLRGLPQWGDDAGPAWEEARALWAERRERLTGLDAAQTEDAWVRPVLARVLGWAWEVPSAVAGLEARALRPGYALFADAGERDAAWAARGDERRYFAHAGAVADAAAWGRPLDTGGGRGGRTPAFQAVGSLAATGAAWAVLTNGREWRLYASAARSRATSFFAVDLARALEEGDEEAFRVFFLFFRAASFRPEARAGGERFVDSVLRGSIEHSEAMERRLREVVFSDVFERLARGFVDGRRRRGIVDETDGALRDVEGATLRLLFRLLFVLHAEARGILPAESNAYAPRGLARIRRLVAEKRDAAEPLSPKSNEIWSGLQALFDLVAEGDPSIDVPQVGGALFRGDDAAGAFLRENAVSDFFLAHALDQLSREGGRFVDYASLPAGQMGALHEALRQHRLALDEGGKPVLVNEKGERKEGPPLHAPRWLADYAAGEALAPALAEREARFRELLRETTLLRTRLAAADDDARERLAREADAAEDRAVDALLGLRVCDPAAGSGAFLLHAASWITDRLVALLAEFPGNPVSGRLAALRGEIARTRAARGMAVDASRLGDAALLKRMVARRCLFGVDPDPLAIEVAKLSLWTDAFVPGAPLPLLDPHLKPGNALVGTRVDEVRRAMEESPLGQFDAFGGPFRGLLRVAGQMRGFSRDADTSPEAAEESAARHRELEAAMAPYRRLLDVWVSRAFGNRLGAELAGPHGEAVLQAARGEPHALGPAHREALARAAALAEEHRFFHWDLEFPEAFVDVERGAWRDDPGFDAVLGAPPHARPEEAHALRPFLASAHADVHDGSADAYVYFCRQGFELLRGGARMAFVLPNRWLRAGPGEGLRRFLAERAEVERVADFAHAPVFPGADVFPCVLVARRPQDAVPDRLGEAHAALVPREALGDGLAAYLAAHAYAVPRTRFGAGPWSLEPRAVEALMEKLRASGVALREYAGGAPLGGIKTGLNDAFVVDAATRERLVAADPSSAEVLRPYLRGQDVDRWSPVWAGTWILALKSGENHRWPWTGAPEGQAERVFQQTYPAVHAHLKVHEERLRARGDQGQHWWELRGLGHYAAFDQPKLVWRDLSFHSAFSFDVEGFHAGDLCFVLPTPDPWLAAVLNSPLMWFYLWRTVAHGKDEVLRLKNVYMETLPVAVPAGDVQSEAAAGVERLVSLTRERRALVGEMLAWLTESYDVAAPGERLEAFADLSAGDFVEEVKRRRPRRADALSPRETAMLRNAHGDVAPRLTAVDAKIAGLERRLSLLVNRAYGLAPEEVELMWSTAPPRMPAGR